MRVNRKGVALGVVGLGLAGALAGGIGIAQAAPGTPPGAPSTAAAWGIGGMHGYGVNTGTCLTAAAKYLGLSDDALQEQLQAGKTLAQVAADRGKSVSGLKEAMLAAAKTNLEANTALTAEQREARLAQLSTWIDTMINQVHAVGAGQGRGPGMRGGRMGGWMHGYGQ